MRFAWLLVAATLSLSSSLPSVSAHGDDNHEPIIVRITDDAFVPTEMTVTQFETVTFKNDGENDHWPASDDHPTHEHYSEFDPQRPLIPGASWSFTFEEVGVWTMHDHLYPDIVGTITVVAPGEIDGPNFWRTISNTISAWWQRLLTSQSTQTENMATDEAPALDTAHREPPTYDKAAVLTSLSLNCHDDEHDCISNYTKSLTAEHGPAAGIDALTLFMERGDIAPSVNDHQLSHEIGRETARQFGVNPTSFQLCPMEAFNGGCQHGFFEYVLGRTDSTTEAADAICAALGDDYSSKFKFYCYHGIGHGVMMQQAYDLNTSLEICDSLDASYAREGCWQGVFMENVNALMTDYAKRNGVFDERDALAPCNRVADEHRQQCYLNHAGYLMQFFANDVSGATNACLLAEDWVGDCMQSIGLMVSNPVWQTQLHEAAGVLDEVTIAAELCQQFPNAHQHHCIKGAVDNINNFDRFDTTRADAFCQLIATEQQPHCYSAIGNNFSVEAVDISEATAACNQLTSPGDEICLGRLSPS